MKKKNIVIIGYGKFAKEYIKVINRIKKFNLVFILNNKNKKFFFKNKHNILKNISAAIIVTPAKSHYIYAKLFLSKNIPLIIEKPVAINMYQINQLIKISKNKLVLVNHSDLYSKYFMKILKIIKEKKIKTNKVKIKFFKYQKFLKNKDSDPAFEWLPHLVAICLKLNNSDGSYKILSYESKLTRGNIYKKFQLLFSSKNLKINVFFSNYPNIDTKRQIQLDFNKNDRIIYDDSSENKLITKKNNKSKVFRDKSYSTLEELLNLFYKKIISKKKINDLYFSKVVMKHVFKLTKKLG